MDTKHFAQDRQVRDNLIKNVIGDTNNVLCVNVLDRGHRNGAERFELTDKGILKVYNVNTNRHITDLVARVPQIKARMGAAFTALPSEVQRKVLEVARENERLGYNWV